MATDFVPGDRLRSTVSGRVYVYVTDEGLTPPVEFPDHIPVRTELWADLIHWWAPSRFEKVDEDYVDPAKSEHQT